MKSITINGLEATLPGELVAIKNSIQALLKSRDIGIFFNQQTVSHAGYVEIIIVPDDISEIVPEHLLDGIMAEVGRYVPSKRKFRVLLEIFSKEFPKGGGI
jgi:hypothetical protein